MNKMLIITAALACTVNALVGATFSDEIKNGNHVYCMIEAGEKPNPMNSFEIIAVDKNFKQPDAISNRHQLFIGEFFEIEALRRYGITKTFGTIGELNSLNICNKCTLMGNALFNIVGVSEYENPVLEVKVCANPAKAKKALSCVSKS